MLSLPQELAQYWLSYSLETSDPAFFQVTSTGALISWGGMIQQYSQQVLEKEQFIGDIFPFLAYSFPLKNIQESMQWVQTESGLVLDVHFCFQELSGWILFVESGEEAEKVQSLMQQGNELKLLRQKYDKVVQRQLEREESSLVLESLLELQPEQIPNSVSILQVRLNLGKGQSSLSSQQSLTLLNSQLKEIFKAAIEDGGIIHHVFGQTVAILFGLQPSPLGSAQNAIQMAHRLVKQFKESPNPSTSAEIAMGIGITTGHLDIDIRPVKNRKIFHIIGQTILRAEEMLVVIHPGFLLIDQNTFNQAEVSQSSFSIWSSKKPISPSNSSFYAQSLNE